MFLRLIQNQLLRRLLVIFTLFHISKSHITLSDGGYEEVVVGVSPYLPNDNANDVVNAIKELLIQASAVLYRATQNKLYFKTAKIVIPDSWASVVQYDEITTYSFADSDIRIDEANGVYENQPYTLQTRECGKPGEYIHLTTEYLVNDDYVQSFGPRGKVFVHEWSKYRWGVFDEVGYSSDFQSPLFYLPEGSTKYKPTHCAEEEIKGQEWNIDDQSTSCNLDTNGLPDQNCVFIPDATQSSSSSLLSFTNLQSVTQFCGLDHDHNSDAPTRHNIMCTSKSVWEVMKQHADFNTRFKRDVDPDKPLPAATKIQVVRQAQAKYCLVLDHSSSMKGSRITKLATTAKNWLKNEVSVGSWVGIVKFSSNAKIVRQLTEITDDNSRDGLSSGITEVVSGNTCIGCGLLVAVRSVLQDSINGVIILLSDGEENKAPYISETLDEVQNAGVKINTVAIGKQADEKLENLAKLTGGKSFYVSDNDEGSMFDDAFQEALVYETSQQILDSKIKIHEFSSNETDVCKKFSVDSSVGRDLHLRVVSEKELQIQKLNLVSPNNYKYTRNSTQSYIKVEMAQQGEWEWCLTLKSSNQYSVEVAARPRDHQNPPIKASTWVEEFDEWLIIYTKLEKGSQPVLRAHVRANITDTERGEEIVIELKDNGQGADVTANDGIYSRYFTELSANTRYSISSKVWSTNGTLISKSDTHLHGSKRRFKRDLTKHHSWCCGSNAPLKESNFQQAEPFERFNQGGTVQIMNKTFSTKDVISPCRVTDLAIINLQDRQNITLTWTAPGDDLDSGIVTGYIIKLAETKHKLTNENFLSENATTIALLKTMDDKSLFVEATANITFQISLTDKLNASTHYYIALKAYDEALNYSPVSAFASLITYEESSSPTSMAGWQITLIILGVIVGILIIAAIAIFILRRPNFKFLSVPQENPNPND